METLAEHYQVQGKLDNVQQYVGKSATRASKMSGGTNRGILDTLALAFHLNGDTAKARETERHALSLLPPGESPLRRELEERLAEYSAADGGG